MMVVGECMNTVIGGGGCDGCGSGGRGVVGKDQTECGSR